MAKQTKTDGCGRSDLKARSTGGRLARACFVLLLAGAVTLAWMSLLTFSPTDWPIGAQEYPAPTPHNAAGKVGAFLAHAALYWLGAGSFMGLIFISVAVVVLIFGGRLRDMPWRLAGTLIIVAATSTAVYLRHPAGAVATTSGTAGVLGAATGRFLIDKLAPTGAWVIVAIAAGIGVILAAENLMLRLPRVARATWRGGSKVAGGLAGVAFRRRSTADGVSAAKRAVVAQGPPPAQRAAPPVAQPPAPPKPEPAPVRPMVVAPKPPVKPTLPKSTRGKEAPLPSMDLLADPTTGYLESQETAAGQKQTILQQTLNDFSIDAEVVSHWTGPVITLFELSLAPGVKVSQVASLATDIARALAVPGVRVVAHLAGRDTIGIEVPNTDREIVRLKDLMSLAPDAAQRSHLPLYLGKDAGGNAIIADLSSMPHLLIAGTTGSGKSVCINSIIVALLLTRRPDQVRFILADPKMVEMAAFERIPHLLCPIVNDMRRAEAILEWAAAKMDERYELLREAGVRNVVRYNRLGKEEIYKRFGVHDDDEKAHVPTYLPYYVIIIDELADLIMTSSREVETHIIRIAQKARAVGIHMILATQRPSVNVVTGLIKSNMPCRISFRVASRQESRIVLDQNGAEVLLGQGDMLLLQPGTSDLVRAQGTFVDETEIRGVVAALRRSHQLEFHAELMQLNARPAGSDGADQRDDLFAKAAEVVLRYQRGSVSLLQRRLQIGYGRASRIIDQMAEAGLLGEYKGSQARECLMSLEEWQAGGQAGVDSSGPAGPTQPTSV